MGFARGPIPCVGPHGCLQLGNRRYPPWYLHLLGCLFFLGAYLLWLLWGEEETDMTFPNLNTWARSCSLEGKEKEIQIIYANMKLAAVVSRMYPTG